MPILQAPQAQGPRIGLAAPTFLLIGAAKAATTSLCSLLEQHPDACMARTKEPHFFSFNHHYQQGWDAYLGLYGHWRGEKAVGDASTSYSRIRYYPGTIARIRRHAPDAKILYMVRHPLDRMASACAEHARTPGAPRIASLNEAVARQPMILDSSRYWEVFDAYRSAFGESNIKVIWFEEYTTNPKKVFANVCRFLGISDGFIPDLVLEARNGRNEAGLDLSWHPALRAQVLASLREDNLKFLRHFGRPDSHWGGIYAP